MDETLPFYIAEDPVLAEMAKNPALAAITKDPVLAESFRQSPWYREKRFRMAIRQVLWRDWDPIGVGRQNCCRDEYDSYIAFVEYFLRAGRPQVEIVEYLLFVETDYMGQTGNRERATAVAEKVQKIEHQALTSFTVRYPTHSTSK